MLARLVKVLEMAIMGVAALGFYWHSLNVLLWALFLLGLPFDAVRAGQVRHLAPALA